MSDFLVEIQNDVLDIASEIKKIDSGYSVKYNKSRSRFELHHEACKPSLLVVFPFDSLDYRSVVHTRKTLSHNALTALKNAEELNQRRERKREEALKEELAYKAKELVKFYDNGGSELVDYKRL